MKVTPIISKVEDGLAGATALGGVVAAATAVLGTVAAVAMFATGVAVPAAVGTAVAVIGGGGGLLLTGGFLAFGATDALREVTGRIENGGSPSNRPVAATSRRNVSRAKHL